eukprot:12900323-Prorocentrum_lima.AAC.1
MLCHEPNTALSPICHGGEDGRGDASGAHSSHKYPYRAWLTYHTLTNAEGLVVRMPCGKLCLLCMNTFRALGNM